MKHKIESFLQFIVSTQTPLVFLSSIVLFHHIKLNSCNKIGNKIQGPFSNKTSSSLTKSQPLICKGKHFQSDFFLAIKSKAKFYEEFLRAKIFRNKKSNALWWLKAKLIRRRRATNQRLVGEIQHHSLWREYMSPSWTVRAPSKRAQQKIIFERYKPQM